MGNLEYHLSELKIIGDPGDPRRILPGYDCKGWKILDVGCGIGQSLTASEFATCAELHGIDIDAEAIAEGRRRFPALQLRVAPAEQSGFPDQYFDLVFSRVAIPYTNVPAALKELHRILKPGGLVWLTLHSFEVEKPQLRDAIRSLSLRRLIDRGYVLLNSALLQTTGRCVARPWNGQFESLQFPSGFRRLLRRRGFADVLVEVNMHLLATARRPSQHSHRP